jgi:hypothetical protein
MKAQNVSFEEVYDKFVLRIVYKPINTMKKFIAWKITLSLQIITDPIPADCGLDFVAQIYWL